MLTLIVLNKDARHTEQLLTNAGFNLSRPMDIK